MKRYPKRLRTLFSCLMIAGAVVACGDDDDPNDPGGGGNGGDGTFSASASGAVSGSHSGDAFFGTVEETDTETGDAVVIVLGDLSGVTSIRSQQPELFSLQESFNMIFASDAASLDEGTYDVVPQPSEGPLLRDGEFIGVLTFTDEDTTPAGSGSALAVSGSIELESVSSGNVEGNFTVQFQVFFGDGTQGTATVSGSFDAVDGTVPIDL